MPKGWANLSVPAIDPARDGYCHPAQAKRTKCACGAVWKIAKIPFPLATYIAHVYKPAACAV